MNLIHRHQPDYKQTIMFVLRRLKTSWATLALLVLMAAVAGLCLRWVFLVPIFQSPDEDQHFDYALAIYQTGGLFRLHDQPDCRLGNVHPYTCYLVERTDTRALPFHRDRKMPPDYGTRSYFDTLDRERPGRAALHVKHPPSLAWVYPFGYYTLLAGWIAVLFRLQDSLVFVFFGARLLSVALLMGSLAAIYGTVRELGQGRGFSLWLTGLIGFFPLTTFVASSIQPDNLSCTLVCVCFYLTLLARRTLDRDGTFILLGLALGGLLIIKVHYFLVTALPALAMLGLELRYTGVSLGRRLRLVLVVGLPALLTGSVYLWTVWGSHNYFAAPAPHADGWTFVLTGFGKAFDDFFLGTTHRSFWGKFGWLDTPLVIGTPPIDRGIRLMLKVAGLGMLGLTLVRFGRVVAVVLRLWRRGRWRGGLRLALAHPVLNSYFLFTALMFFLYIRLDNRFGAQGRNWFPLLLPIFLTAVTYAPRALPGRRRQAWLRAAVMAGLTLYTAVGAGYAIRSIQARFYDPPSGHAYNEGMNLDKVLNVLSRDPGASFDVAEIALELARDEYPQLDVEGYLAELTAMAHEARAQLKGNLPARVAGLCRYLFHDMGFRGNQENYYDPRNSYLNQVLDRRTGIPISLSAVALAVGTRAGLEIVGVGLPGHFVAKAIAGKQEMLFDPFHGGRLLTPEHCERLVEQVTGMPFRATPVNLAALPLGGMVQRMLTNLKAVYLRDGDFVRAARVIQRLCQLDPEDPLQQRDLGVSWLRAGQPGKAIDPLSTYLAASPPAADAETVRRLLEQAQAAVARWN
jgi:regulator of sirC expression with transglutaminase-like and TPR domain